MPLPRRKRRKEGDLKVYTGSGGVGGGLGYFQFPSVLFPPLRHSAAINQRAGAMKRKKTAAASETAPPEVSPPRPPEEEGTIVTAGPGKKQ